MNRFDGMRLNWHTPNFNVDDWGFNIIRPRRIGRIDDLFGQVQDMLKPNYFDLTPDPKPISDLAMAFGMAMMADHETSKVAGKNLCILAPERMLITSGNMKQGHILLNDPIILQPVPCGYLIVTSWGLEAADQAILNASHN